MVDLPDPVARARQLLEPVGLARRAGDLVRTFSRGMRQRLAIARALLASPQLLLLDEPAAGCNPVETQELDRVIRSLITEGITVVLVEHDMRLVMNISARVHVLASGRTLAQGTPREVRSDPAVIEAYLGSEAQAHA